MIDKKNIIDKIINPSAYTIISSVLENLLSEEILDILDKRNIQKIVYKAVDYSFSNYNIPGYVIRDITDRILNSFASTSPFDMEKILMDARVQNPMELSSVNLYETATNINHKISNMMIEEPELRGLITKKTMEEVLSISKKLEDDMRIMKHQVQKLFLEFMNNISSYMDMVNNMSDNSKAILDEYQSYFMRPLFLEDKLSDGKAANLSDVYIENSYTMLDFNVEKKSRKGLFLFIKDFINENLLTNNYGTKYSYNTKNIVMLFVKGQPGSGKSSLFYALAYMKTHDFSFMQDKKFYFAKLIECFSTANEAELRNPFNTIRKSLKIDKIDNNCVFVLDGLDEICALKGFDNNDFCERLIVKCVEKKVKCIITTRMNYINLPHINNKNVFNIQLNELNIDDLKEWTNKYFAVHSELDNEKKLAVKNIDYILANNDKTIGQVFAVPLLFYMIVATAIDIEEIDSVGKLYDKVFEELKTRSYNENELALVQQHGTIKLFGEDIVRNIAMKIAMIMYRNNELLLKVNSQELRKEIDCISSDFMLNTEEKENIEKLYPITFFYKKQEDVVEFAHKSIMEYFVGSYLCDEFISFDGSLIEFIEDYLIEPVVTGEVVSFFMYFWNKESRKDVINHYWEEDRIRNEFKKRVNPINGVCVPGAVYSYECTNIFFRILWFFLRSVLCISNTTINDIFVKDEYNSGFLKNILSIKVSNDSSFFNDELFPWDFSGLELDDFCFSYSKMRFANFTNSNFKNVDFLCCKLDGARFNYEKLKQTGFSGCSLCEVEFSSNETYRKPEKIINKKPYNKVLNFDRCDMTDVSFDNIDLSRISFNLCKLSNLRMKKVRIEFKTFSELISQTIFLDKIVIDYYDSEGKLKEGMTEKLLDEMTINIRNEIHRILEINQSNVGDIHIIVHFSEGKNSLYRLFDKQGWGISRVQI